MDDERKSKLLDRYERATELPLLFLALSMVPLLLAPYAASLSDAADMAIETSFWAIWGVFAVDLAIRTYLAPRKFHYLAAHWYDVLIVVVPFLRPLRVLRSARALRLLRLSRVAPFLARSAAGIRQFGSRRGIQWVMLFGVAAVFASASIVYELERSEGGSIDDFGTALWWGMSTITTVGYGDATPVSPEGRGVAVVLMLIGISFFSWVTANIAAFLVESSPAETITAADLMRKLESLELQIQALRGSQQTRSDAD